jgi:phosphoesterase RecJ-like protein
MIASHANPDGDSIGTSLALANVLESKGHEVVVVCNDPVPQNLRFLPAWERIISFEDRQFSGIDPDDYDLAVLVDVNSFPRLGRIKELVAAVKRHAILDHHEPGDDMPAGTHVVFSEFAASALLLLRALPAMGVAISKDTAQCLLTGINTDTGCFRFDNTTPDALRAAAELIEMGADMAIINESVWLTKPWRAIRLHSLAMGGLKMAADGKIAYSTLTRDDFETAGAADEDSEGIVNEIGKVDTAVLFALFRESRPGKIRVSVRSRGKIDVAEICRGFNGGGHKKAAGCTIEGDVEGAVAQMLPALISAVERA